MAKIVSDLSNTSAGASLPKNVYIMEIIKCDDVISKEKEENGRKVGGGNPMFVFTYKVTNDPNNAQYEGRQVGFHNVVYGGVNERGEPNNIGRVLDQIIATKIPWDHTESNCGSVDITASPVRDMKRNAYFCPECSNQIKAIAYDPDHFLHKMVKVDVGVRKQQGSDKEFNDVKAVLPL